MAYLEEIQQIKALLRSKAYQPAFDLAVSLLRTHPRDSQLHKLLNKAKVYLQKAEIEQRKGFIQNGLQVIKKLRKGNDFEHAIQACKELLEVDPENEKAKHLLKKSKIDLIEQRLKSPLQKQLEQQHEYEKLYLFYQKLRKVFPHYPKLNRLVFKTEKKALAKDRERKRAFAEKTLTTLREWYANGKYEQVIRGVQELMAYTHQGSTAMKKLLKQAQKANLREIEKDTLDYMLKQGPIMRAAYESHQGGVIKL